jgi:acyl-CoA thioesterase I
MHGINTRIAAALLSASLAGGLGFPAGSQAQQSQTAPAAASPAVGVLADPCAALEPMPAEVAAYFHSAAKARAAKEPAPVPTASGIAQYQAWQSRQIQQDFSQQCRYAAANLALPVATPHRVILFGDSITELWAQLDPGFFSDDTIDRGISGQTTDQMLGRFRTDVIALNPQIVQILAGTNDIAGNTGPTSLARIENHIASMVELARLHHIRVILASVPPAARFAWRPSIEPVKSIAELNAWIKHYAATAKVTYVDFYSALEGEAHGFKSDLSSDGVHPNAAGYAIMRPLAMRGISDARRRSP